MPGRVAYTSIPEQDGLVLGLGVGLAAYGLRRGWHWPVGLISPILLGLLTAAVLSQLLNRYPRYPTKKQQRGKLGKLQRASGIMLGSSLGFAFAVAGWQVALFIDCLKKPLPAMAVSRVTESQVAEARVSEARVSKAQTPTVAPPSVKAPQNSWSSLVGIARQGFLKHLPIAGPFTEEVLAVAAVLKTPVGIRKEFAKHKGWDALAELPSLQAISQDEALFSDINAAASGDFRALYRLQKHPLVIAFSHEEALQNIIADLQARQIASELEEFRNQQPFHAVIDEDFEL